MPIDDLIKKTPDAITDGKSWWIEKRLTDHAKSIGLNDVICWVVKFTNGELIRLITKGNEPVYEHTSSEAIWCRLDVLKLLQD